MNIIHLHLLNLQDKPLMDQVSAVLRPLNLPDHPYLSINYPFKKNIVLAPGLLIASNWERVVEI